MSLLHSLANIATCLAALLFVVAGMIGVQRRQTPGGWLWIGGGILAFFGAAGAAAWPAVREMLGHPGIGIHYRHSRIIGICLLIQSTGWILVALGSLQTVISLLWAIKQCEELRGLMSERDLHE